MPTTTPPKIIEFWDKGIDGSEGGVRLNFDGTLSWITDNAVTSVATSSTALSTGQWYRIEANYDAADGAEVRIDGVTEITVGAHDGDAIDSVWFGCDDIGTASCSGSMYFDDIALNDTSGTAQTGFPGAGSIVQMQPDSAGDTNNCSAGNVTSIDEITPNDATDTCTLPTNGNLIDVNVESSSAAGIDSYDTVTLVQVGGRATPLTAASSGYATRVKSASGGTTTTGTTMATAATVAYRTNICLTGTTICTYRLTSYTDPTTAVAWTPTGTNSIDNMQIGASVSDAAPDLLLTTVWAIVEYVDGVAPSPSTGLGDIILFE